MKQRKQNRKNSSPKKSLSGMTRKEQIYEIIFEADTREGKLFDVVLLVFILVSILLIIVDSLHLFTDTFNQILHVLEWIITLFFTVEYVLRIYCSPKPKKYIFSFYGIVDLISTLPLYMTFFFRTAAYLVIARSFRLIRVFRIFRLFGFISEGNVLLHSLKESRRKIFVFFLFVLILTISLGTLMYMIEGANHTPGFDNILNSIYWTIVTLTTVGYGDITPMTGAGRFLSALVMLLGYTIIAVPTGIVSATMMQKSGNRSKKCPHCEKNNDLDASYCKYCGQPVNVKTEEPSS